MKKIDAMLIGVLAGVMFVFSCAKEKISTAPSGSDILVLTQPAGTVPGNISAIETSTGAVSDDILPGGTGAIPNEILLRGSTLWVVNSAQGSIQNVLVSESNGNLSLSTQGRAYLPPGGYPEYMEFLGDNAFITLYSRNSIGVVDTARNLFTEEILLPQGFSPWGIAVSGSTLLVAGTGVSPGVVLWINGNTGSTEFSAPTTRANASSIAVDAAAQRVFVTTSDFSDSTNGALDVFNAATGQKISSVSTGAPLGSVALSNGKVYIADLFGPRLHIVDVQSGQLKDPLGLTTNSMIGFITGVRVNPRNGLVYACGWGLTGGEVYEVDPATDSVRKIYTIKGPAQDVAFR